MFDLWSGNMKGTNIFFVFVIIFTGSVNSFIRGPRASLDSPEDFLNVPGSTEPYFDMVGIENVTAMIGSTAYLNCRVRNLGNKTVSWIRHQDIHILTVGQYTYSSDNRFKTINLRNSDDWTLHIHNAQEKDSGLYECQISTQPIKSYFVNLAIVVPTAKILGVQDLYVDKGSMINLTCIIKYSTDPPDFLFWHHKDKGINYDSPRGGVSVITEKGKLTISYLLIQNARPYDSGVYKCSPSNANTAFIRIHVLNGESPAAMYSGASQSSLFVSLCLAEILVMTSILPYKFVVPSGSA